MYLKSMELQGFKSFPDKTVLNFERGVTVVVGPNGSGKSNISDAMRWVLGEISSKNIRGNRMEDVIFGGADTRAPMGYAEVSVTFDNTPARGKIDCPYDEITVTRRYYRAGDSEYYINRKPVRLKDIHELFMSTGIGREGYSIIGQGRIGEILSRKSEDRRSIFEEAAGISKYRYKKQESERSLAAAEDNILRINDIFGELAARIGPLEHDAEKARKYLDYYEEKKKADVSLWLYDTQNTRAALNAAEESFKLSESELSLASEALDQLEKENDRVFEDAQSNKQHSEHLWNEIKRQNDTIHSLDSEFKLAENDIGHCEEKIAASHMTEQAQLAQIEQLRGEAAAVAANTAALKQKLTDLAAQKEQIAVQQAELLHAVADKEAYLEQELTAFRRLEAKRTELRVRLSVIENARSTDSVKNADVTAEIAKYQEISARLAQERSEAEETIAEYVEKLSGLGDRLFALRRETDAATAALGEKQQERGRAQVSLGSVEQKIENLKRMEEHFEGYSNSVRYVMRAYERGEIKGTVYGPLSKLIHTADRSVVAIETALGAAIQNIVVDNENTAKDAIYALKAASAGRATFYPLTSVKAGDPTPEMQRARSFAGFVSFADELVECDERFRRVVRSQLGRTVVFDNIENATAMAKSLHYSVRAVTLDGQQINVGGSFTGGSLKRDSGMLTRGREIERLEKDRADAMADFAAAGEACKACERKLAETKNEYNAVFENKSVLETMCAAERARLEQVNAKTTANEELLASIEGDYQRLSEKKEQYEKDAVTLREEIAGVENEQAGITDRRNTCEVERNDLTDKVAALTEQTSALLISEAETRKEIEAGGASGSSYAERIAFHENEADTIRQQRETLQEEIVRRRSSLDENRTRVKLAEEALAGLDSERKGVDADALSLEQRLTELRARIKDKTAQKELLFRSFTKSEAKLAQLKNDSDKMTSKLWDDYELTHSGALELGYPEVTADNRAEVAARQTEYKNKLRNLGTVNVGAIEEYADVRARYDNMKRQLDDLEDTRKDLQAIISDLESEMRGTFVEAFDKINTNFNEVFGELFGGGSAEIVLTEPEDVLTSGIEIKAAPPGKIIKSLSLLSGGEQAFVAIALFFAIIKYSPTPFSILDEIEAALDEVNVDRFAEYVRKYSLETQFVLITHRRGTMEIADRLYGVTMPQKGISRVLTLSVSEVEKFKKDMLA